MRRRSDAVRLAVRLVGPLLLVVLIANLEDPRSLWRALADARWGLVAAAVSLNLPVIHLKVVRWRGLLRELGFPYALGAAYVAVCCSLYLGTMTPGRVGDALRVQYVRHELDAPYSSGIAVSLMDRFCDLAVVAGVAGLGLLHFGPVVREDVARITWVAIAIALLAPVLLLWRATTDMLKRLLVRLSSRWHASVDRLLECLRALVRPSLVRALPLTVASFAIIYLQGWLLARSIGLDLSYVDVAALLSVTSLLGLIPISISGLGVRELFMALVFPLLGFTPAQGVLFGLLVFASITLATALPGLVLWQLRPPPFKLDESS